MTRAQFIAMIGEAETGAIRDNAKRLAAIGDNSQAGGWYQQHWTWRVDYWPAEYWRILKAMDERALEYFLSRHPLLTAAELADLYNLGHEAPDPAYEARCLAGLQVLGIDPAELHAPITN